MGGRVDVSTVLDLIAADGFCLSRSSGSHHIYFNDNNGKSVTVPWSQKGDFLPVGTAKSIVRQAGPHIESALKDVMRGGAKALKRQVKALREGAAP